MSIIGTGISSIAVQLLTIREFLTQFHGNEITISLVLFCWLLVTGLGSLLAKPLRRSSLAFYAGLSLLTGVWPLVQLILVRILRGTFFVHGSSPGFYAIFIYVLTTTAPYCLLVGFVLPYALRVLKDLRIAWTSGKLYITDSIGDITGGVLFSFLLVYWLKPFKTVFLASGLLILVSLLILLKTRRYLFLSCGILIAGLFGLCALNGSFEISTLAGQYGQVTRYLESPYGRIVITQEGRQHTFWESGLPLYSNGEIVTSEEKIHYPLSQLESVGNVLLISGGLGETLQEVLKHHPKGIDYVELDPQLTRAAEELGFIEKSSVLSVINSDGRRYVGSTGKRYDAVIIDLPDPDTFQINRFFTTEFFALCKGILREKGILSFGLSYSPNYIGPAGKAKLSTMLSTARAHFENVLILPGEEAYFLCRDAGLRTDIPSKLEAKRIPTAYIQGFYRGNVTEERIRALRARLDAGATVNRDFQPRIMGIVFKEWFSKHGTSPKMMIGVVLAFTIFYLIFIKKEEYILFATGLVTMGAEMIVIIAFQVIYGFVYLKVGAVVTTFLMGLLPGALLGNRHRHRALKGLFLTEVVLLGLLALSLVWVFFFRSMLHEVYFLAFGLTFSFFCGYQFPAVTYLIGEDQSPAAGCIAADLMGAALGTLATGALLIPLWGIPNTIIVLILVKISSIIMALFIREKRLSV